MSNPRIQPEKRAARVPLDTLVGCSSKGVKKHLDLFSGIGGFALAAEWVGGFETIAFCEIEKYPKKLLAQNFPGVPIFEDVRKLHAEDLPCKPDVITGGYPCQPFSVAGKQRGEADDRHLWPEMLRLIQECRPGSVICENVAGHIKMGLDTVLSDLEDERYTCWTFVIPACSKGFPHRRDRVWIVANRNGSRLQTQRAEQQTAGTKQHRELGKTANANPEHSGRNATTKQRSNGAAVCNIQKRENQAGQLEGIYTPRNVANANGLRLQRISRQGEKGIAKHSERGSGESFRGFTQSPVCRRDDGIPHRA